MPHSLTTMLSSFSARLFPDHLVDGCKSFSMLLRHVASTNLCSGGHCKPSIVRHAPEAAVSNCASTSPSNFGICFMLVTRYVDFCSSPMDAKTDDASAPCFARNASAANHVIKTHAHITPCAPAHSHIPCFMMASIAGRIDSFSINASISVTKASLSLSNLSCIFARNAARAFSSSAAFCSSSSLSLSRFRLRSPTLPALYTSSGALRCASSYSLHARRYLAQTSSRLAHAASRILT
mmetsp:Transcript_23300/g.65294  ORF Transcript_23300/g.65294 Transcript_23300/m.65294 type:complete len:237 (+) Transcript_23300:1133-1843(+)